MFISSVYKGFFLIFCVSSAFSLEAVPVVTGVSPLSGSVAGGETLTLTGSGFTGATLVTFGVKTAVPIVVDDSTIHVTAPINVFGAVDVLVTAPGGTSAPNPPFDYFTYQGHWYAYVPDFGSNNVIPLEIINDIPTVEPAISLTSPPAPPPSGTGPNNVAFVPDGTIAASLNSQSNSMSIIDVATQTVTKSQTLSGAFPIFSITPDGKNAIICNYSSATVTLFNMENFSGINIAVGNNPSGVAIMPRGDVAFVANSGSNYLSRIDLTNPMAGSTQIAIPENTPASFIEIVPSGDVAVLTLDSLNAAKIFFPPTSTFANGVIDGFTLSNGGNFLPEISCTPDGTTAWITNCGSNTISSVVGLNTPTPAFGASITVGNAPNGIAVTPDGKTAYVSNGDSMNVSLVNLPNGPVGTYLVGTTPTDIGITADQAPVAYFTPEPAASGSATIFDASASLSPVGSIASYTWDFGDGTAPVTTASPSITHTYAIAGSYTVTLKVTNTAGTSTTQIYTGQVMLQNGGPSAQLSQTVIIPPAPATGFRGHCAKNKFLTQTDHLIKLSWNRSQDPSVVEYLIYRDGKQIATIPASHHTRFIDHNRHEDRSYVYTLFTVSGSGIVSAESITVKPCKRKKRCYW